MNFDRASKPLFFKSPLTDVLTNFQVFTENVSVFIDKVKVIFEQKGYVASGLKAKVMVNKKPLSFSA